MNYFLRHLIPVVFWVATCSYSAASMGKTEHFYNKPGKTYRYFVTQSGDNYSFEFETNPGNADARFQAGLHVLNSIYHDPSIKPAFKQPYIRERAQCYALESSLHTYSLCFLPNDFSTINRDRFRGFVTQMPNGKWMLIYNLLPALLVFGLLFFFTQKKTDSFGSS